MKTSRPCWQSQLARLAQTNKIAVVGIGNELRGDDAAGVAVARMLSATGGAGGRLLIIEAGTAPENQIGPLIRGKPDVILFVDAADMGEVPGTVRWVSWEQAEGMGVSTHTLSPQVLAQFLTTQLACEVHLLGIQPASLSLGAELSPSVDEAVKQVVGSIVSVLLRPPTGAGPEDTAAQTATVA